MNQLWNQFANPEDLDLPIFFSRFPIVIRVKQVLRWEHRSEKLPALKVDKDRQTNRPTEQQTIQPTGRTGFKGSFTQKKIACFAFLKGSLQQNFHDIESEQKFNDATGKGIPDRAHKIIGTE